MARRPKMYFEDPWGLGLRLRRTDFEYIQISMILMDEIIEDTRAWEYPFRERGAETTGNGENDIRESIIHILQDFDF